jgi:5-methylthioadenosine/S-adenosylhomocysteine deaminase
MTPIDLLINARWIIPVVPENRILNDCAIAVHQGYILAVLPQEEAAKRYLADRVENLKDHIVMPGLINAHGHAAMTLLRGFADDQPLNDWLNNHIWPAEKQWVNEQFVRDGTELAIAEMIKSGTTCFGDMYFFPEQTAQAALEAQIRCQIYFTILDTPCPWGSCPEDYFAKGLALHDTFRDNDLINIGFGPHAPYTVGDETLKKVAILAQEMDAPIHIHLHETAQEVEESLQKYGVRPTQRLMALGLLSPLTQCAHMTQVDDVDIAILQQSGAHIVHCPESNLKLASGFCPVDQLLKAGINVALGTDGAASNNDLDLFSELKTATLLAKAVSGDPAALDAHTALRLATINGAKALGIEHLVGSLEVGKQADVIAIHFRDLDLQPLYSVASQLVYTNVGHRVSHSWVKGKCLMQDRELLTINERELKSKVRSWQEKIGNQ